MTTRQTSKKESRAAKPLIHRPVKMPKQSTPTEVCQNPESTEKTPLRLEIFNAVDPLPPEAVIAPLALGIAKILHASDESLHYENLHGYAYRAMELWQATHDARRAREREIGTPHALDQCPDLEWSELLRIRAADMKGLPVGKLSTGDATSKSAPGLIRLTPTAFLALARKGVGQSPMSITESARLIGVGRNDVPSREAAMKALWAEWVAGEIKTPFDRRPRRRKAAPEGVAETDSTELSKPPESFGALVFDGTPIPVSLKLPLCNGGDERLIAPENVIALRVMHLFNPSRKTGAGAAPKPETNQEKKPKKRGRPRKEEVYLEAVDTAEVHLPRR